MKLYFTPGMCSLSPHIVLRECNASFDLIKVNLREKVTASGEDFTKINPRGQVPVLELDNGDRLTEGSVIVQYIADNAPESGLVPLPGSFERYRLMEWLSNIGTELHKSYSPLFRATTPKEYAAISRDTIARRVALVDQHLAGNAYLMGDRFSVADAYMFTILRWSPQMGIDLSAYANVAAYLQRIRSRPAVEAAMKAEGLPV